jgi:hypothetical protein
VEFIPDDLADGVVYVSMTYATAVHRCCCGCGVDVVTPLAPNRWSLTFDGASISLTPSIGNWSFACQSHYWISRSKVRWSRRFSSNEIAAVRRRDGASRDEYVLLAPPNRTASTWRKIKDALMRRNG